MKRLIALAMSAVMMLSLTACAGSSEASSSAPEGSSAWQKSVPPFGWAA